MGDKENGYRDTTSVPDSVPRRSHEETPKPAAVPRPRDNAIPLPYSGYNSVSHGRKEPSLSLKGMQGEPGYKDRRERDERQSVTVHSDSEFVTRKTIRDDSVISRKRYEDDTSRSLSSKVESPRCIPERSKPSPRRKSTRDDEHISEENKTRFCEEIDAPLPGYKEIKTSPVISELRKKIDQLNDKVDTLDDRRAKMNLERYVDDHSERKPDVDIKPPVHIKRYQPTERKPGSGSEVDGPDSHIKRESITSETISRQISRQTSEARTVRQTSSIQEDVTKQQFQGEEVISPTSKPDQKPTVIKRMCDAQTMTPPDIQEHVGTTVIQRQDSIVDERDRLKELRGIPIDHGRRTAQIEEVGRGQENDTGVTMIQVDSQQQTISPKKNVREWWNAFTAEDVDRLLELGNWSPWNAYTAEDADRMFYVGPVRRRSFRRSSLRRYPKIRQYKDDPVDVLVRVRGRQEKRRRPQCIIAQAAPEEKAIVLRETKETTEPYIRKIKVDDVYGADAVRVENGVVKIKVGDKGRKTWARILQKKDHIVESDGTVIVPVSGDQYEDGIYYSSYYKGQQQDGKAVRTPIKFKIQEQNAAKSNKIRVAREMRRTGSMRRRRKAAARSLCPYIVGARYYNGKIMLTCADANRSQARAQSGHREIVVRQPQSNSRVTGNEIVLRRSSQPPAFPVKTIQEIHEGHKTTSHAATTRSEDGKMIITVHAAPPRPPRFSLKQAGQNMTSSSYYDSTSEQRDVSSASGNYFVSSTSGPQGYVTSSRPGRHGKQGTSYYVTDPSDSFGRRSGYHSASRYHSSNERSSTPTIVPYGDGTSRIGTQNGSFIANPSSYYGFYNAPGSKIVSSDPRLNASTGYGEKFDLRDYGGISSVRYANGARQGSRIINERMMSNGPYRYGSSWNSRQQETLNGRSMSWAVEEVAPDS